MEAGAQEEGAQVEGAQEEEASLGEDPQVDQAGPLAQDITQGTMDVVVVLEVLDLG